MKVFISWSKPLSREVAQALHAWLPQVLQSVEPFVSAADIDAGRRWSATIAGELQDSNFGILCVTRENRHEPWLNFEAGALAKNLEESYVVPLLIGLSPADLDGPLSQFQAVTTLSRDGMATILTALDRLTPQPLGEERLREAVEVWWPRLEPQLNAATSTDHGLRNTTPVRDQRDILEEVLTLVRGLSDEQIRTAARVEAIELGPYAKLQTPQSVVREALRRLRAADLPVESVATMGSNLRLLYGRPPDPLEQQSAEWAVADLVSGRVVHEIPPRTDDQT